MPPPDPESSGRGRGGGVVSRVTKNAGINKFVWDVRHQSGLTAVPGVYRVRLKVGEVVQMQEFNLLIDPRVAAGGVTVADLQELFDHNTRMRELSASATQTVARVRAARAPQPATSGAGAEPKAKRINEIYEMLVNTPEGVRYNKPGLPAHITYLANMTRDIDQKVGRDALDRYQVLKKELDAIRAELDRLLGAGGI